MQKLSPRLSALYQKLLPQFSVWDLCCDHGYIALKAFQDPSFPEVHAVDIVPNIIFKLKQRISSKLENSNPSVQLPFHFNGESGAINGYASSAVDIKNVNGNVLIAGVGTETIMTIFSAHANNTHIKRWVISTHTNNFQLRYFLSQQSRWFLAQEDLVLEKKHYREILVLEQKGQEVSTLWNFLDSPSNITEYLDFRLQTALSIEKQGGITQPSSATIKLAITKNKL